MGSTEGRLVEAEDLYAIWTVPDVSIQPEADRVAYTAAIPVGSQREAESHIFVVDANAEPRQWTTAGRNRRPRWSPDGRWLGFLSRRQGLPFQVYVMPATGGEARPWTQLARGVEDFAWAPDGRRLVVVAASADPWREPVDRGPEPPRVIDRMPYRLNGQGYTYDRHLHLYLVDGTTKAVTPLTDGPYNDTDPAWSPDGSEIAFVSARHESRDRDLGQDVFVLRLDDLSMRRITGTRGAVHDPAWCPDGCHVAYLGTTRLDSTPSHGRLFLADRDGAAHRRLAVAWDRHMIGRPHWRPDHLGLWVLAEDDGTTDIWDVPVDAATLPRMVGAGRRQVVTFDVATAGNWFATVSSTPTRPPEVRREATAPGPSDVPLSHLHDAWLAEVRLSPMEPYTAVSADGTTVSCWLMRPTAAPDLPHPGLLKIHGGPFAQYGYGFSHEFQFWCAAGYTVLMCNPRGSSGLDEDWARSLGTARGVVDYEDILACVDGGLSRDPALDPKRLAVTGGSYGGYLTSWIVGHTDRFCVACAEAAPTNLYSMSGSGDMAGRNRRFQYGFTAQENPEFYWRLSPIAYALDINTPVLIVHGENDYRVPIEQGEQLFSALFFQGKPARLVRFPNENHGLARNGHPAHRVERLRLMREWFARWGA